MTDPIQSRTFGHHDTHPSPQHPVAPTDGAGLNTLRPALAPVACWRLSEALFEFDSSFLLPAVAADLRGFASLVAAHPGAPASVFGHADPTGQDAYNKALSGRRARAIYALLVRDLDAWEALYSEPHAGDTWGPRTTQRILGWLSPDPPGVKGPASQPYYAGSVDGIWGPKSQGAAKHFQEDHADELSVDGIVGPKTRRVLYRIYMDAVCLAPGEPLVLSPTAFIGQGQDAGGKAALQGCGEHNPVLLFSSADQARYAALANKAERDEHNRPNRRVLVFLFRPGTVVTAADWPCPTWDEGPEGCRPHFWPDGEVRRTPGAEERVYGVDKRTMACRFYDRFARRSPCEGSSRRERPLVVSLYVGGADPEVDGDLVVVGAGSEVYTRIPLTSGELREGFCFFELDPAELPDPVEIHWDRGTNVRLVLERCSLRDVRDAIAGDDLAQAGQTSFGPADT